MKKILLVEDDSRVSAFIIKGLQEEGYDVALAMDGKTGLQMALQGNYDLVILDIMIPEMNGIEVCKALRKQHTHVPVLFLTALGSTENVVMGLDSGADDYLSKQIGRAHV